jgi:hypothetical protein
VYFQTTAEKFNSYIFRFVVAMFPYIFLADGIYELNILGSSLYFVLLLFLLFLLFCFNLIREKSFYSFFFILSILFIYLLFLLVNIAINENTLNYLKDYRIGVGLFIYIYVIKATIVNDREKYFVGKIILVNAIVLSVFALLHHFYFEHIIVCQLSKEAGMIFVNDINLRGMRECSFVFQPTVFANLVLMAMFINFFFSKNIFKKIKWISFTLTIIFLSAILLSLSRIPIVFAILLTLMHFYKLNKSKGIFWYVVTISSLIIISTSLDHPVLERLSRLDLGGNRSERYLVGLQTVFSNLNNLIIGTDRLLMTEIKTSGGVKFTDNSFIYISLFHGVIYFFILTVYLIMSLWNRVDISKNICQLLLVLFIFLELLFTSFIFQDILLLYSFTTLILIGNYHREKIHPKFNTY